VVKLVKLVEVLGKFETPGSKDRKRKLDFQAAIENRTAEFQGLGIEMNHRYISDAVFLPDRGRPLPRDKVRAHQIITYPASISGSEHNLAPQRSALVIAEEHEENSMVDMTEEEFGL
jgi:hypothetical protein